MKPELQHHGCRPPPTSQLAVHTQVCSDSHINVDKEKKMKEENTGNRQPPGRHIYGIDFKILHCLILELLHLQTCISARPECGQVTSIPQQPFTAGVGNNF